MRNPIQPILEVDGRPRFKANAIVEKLLDAAPIDMNDIAAMDFSREDREQFAQLIGYSLGGFSELGYVTDATLAAATAMYEAGADERDARIAHLEGEIEALKDGIRGPMARLFNVHPDDLE